MFDLEERIREWRRAQAEALGGRAEVIDELESHLREDVQRLVQSGQTAELAWETALVRLGSPRQLAAEFGKLPAAAAARWLPARLVLFVPVVLGVALVWFLLARMQQGSIGPLLAGHIFSVTMGYTAGFAVGALAVWSILTRALRGWDARRNQAMRSAVCKLTVSGLVLTAMGVALGCWWARENLGRFWEWDPREIGGLSVVAWEGLMLLCLRCRSLGERAGMAMGVAGNVVVSLSWFGPNLVATEHSYGLAWNAIWVLGGFVLIQLLMVGVMFVPTGWVVGRRA